MQKLFNKFISFKHDIQNLAGIVQNEGTTVSEEELAEWNDIARKLANNLNEAIKEVNELYK